VIERQHEKAISACSLLNDGLHEHLSALVNDQLTGARSTTVSLTIVQCRWKCVQYSKLVKM
jgi:hypothetical protein